MTKFLTEEEIRAFVRDEWSRLTSEKQALCKHARSGTLQDSGNVTCDECGKIITADDISFDNTFSPLEQRALSKHKER